MAITSPSSFACFALIVVFVEGRGICPPGTYWDHALGKCDQCSSICNYMEQQGTVTSCESNCPGYKSSHDVPPKPEDIAPIENKDTKSTDGVTIGVSVAASIIIISIIAGALLLRRSRRSRAATVPSQILDTSAPMLSTGHARENRQEEQDHELDRGIPVNDGAH
ncbi:uncharacterized protein LOC124259288 [Haliotis rubra]|uniref:uncharacterized protein LOC124259288 n=1 Tax=Haliotis rubra TaxID=36100 RepID=UPI001EE6015E|nr:uncharacterized protein LOC124259288 [Haliotis rubra]